MYPLNILLSFAVCCQVLAPAATFAQLPSNRDSAAVVELVANFHRALASGDSTAALDLLAPDVIVLESGAMETLDDYRAHHLPADIEFARSVPSHRTVRQVQVLGSAAWVTATSATRGTFRERPIDSEGAELIVLRKTEKGWRIAAIHWSSRTHRRN